LSTQQENITVFSQDRSFESLAAVRRSVRGTLYLLVDASAVDNFVHYADAFRSTYVCLFGGPVAIEMEDVAPYLLRVGEGDPSFDDFAWDIFCAGNGTLLDSALELMPLKRFIKKFLRVREGRKEFFVKFYRGGNFELCLSRIPDYARMFEKIDTLYCNGFALNGAFREISGSGVRA
jgi:hypothetical protein